MNIVYTILACLLISLGFTSIDGFWLFQSCLVLGGMLLGHVVTEALNDPAE